MKFLLVLVFLVGCTTTPTRRKPVTKEKTYQEKLGKSIEDCMVRLKREGIDERLIGPYCDRTHREQPVEINLEIRENDGLQQI